MTKEKIASARSAVDRMQRFDVQLLPRAEDLGRDLNFEEAVPFAARLVALYRQISLSALEDLPEQSLDQVESQANSDYNFFQQMQDFKQVGDNPKNQRDQIVARLRDAYAPAFNRLHSWISYGVSKSADFQRLEAEARGAVQAVRDDAAEITKQMEDDRLAAESILADIRKVAAEQGVSQQAEYFKAEAEGHSAEAEAWRKRTIGMAWVLGVYAALTVFLHKWEWLKPGSDLEALQLMASKVLVFAVLSYVLFLSAKNFLSHKHNEIVNKHRQNALMTFKALTDAASDEQSKDVVLTHASSCIFSPQDTGYTKNVSSQHDGVSRTAVELIPRAMVRIDG